MRTFCTLVAACLCVLAILAIAATTSEIAQAQAIRIAPLPKDPGSAAPGRSTASPANSQVGRPDTSIPGVRAVQPVQPVQQQSNTATAGTASTQNTTTSMSAAPDIEIGPGDLLEISVYGAPDFDRVPARVSGTGEILMPLLGSVKVGGMQTDQAAALLRKKLLDGGFYADPQVTVFAREYATQGVSVLGEVQKPGVYPVLGQRKLFDVISLAGGLTPRAGKFVTISRTGSEPQNYAIGNDPEHSMDANVDIKPGDTIMVSKAGIVYVVGDVRMPGGFVMDSGTISVLQAVAMAQGPNPTAKLENAKLIRRTAGNQQEIAIPLKQMLASKQPDMTLQPDDIVFVPASAAKSAVRRGLEAIVQTATGVTIYRSRIP